MSWYIVKHWDYFVWRISFMFLKLRKTISGGCGKLKLEVIIWLNKKYGTTTVYLMN
jgi:hypothetical protein